MKKPQVNEEYDWYYEDTGRDYKLQHQINDIKNNFESTMKWLYLGADINDPSFVKIGITNGNLRSRSYSSSRPTYHLFCAFKFRYNLSMQEMKNIEVDILARMENIYCNRPNDAKRLNHYESGRVSECFQPVNFFNFYKDLHLEILEYHRNSFVICNYKDSGEFVDCIFNPRVDNSNQRLIEMIVQSC